MSDTIIIRRNGEKFAVDCSTVLEAFNGHLKVKFDGIICQKCGASDSCWIPVRKVEDDGEVAELKRQVKIASDFYLWVVENAENELLQTIRDKAIEAEFKMNHPELDGIDFNEEDAK